jgi:hypothetical protein
MAAVAVHLDVVARIAAAGEVSAVEVVVDVAGGAVADASRELCREIRKVAAHVTDRAVERDKQ